MEARCTVMVNQIQCDIVNVGNEDGLICKYIACCACMHVHVN